MKTKIKGTISYEIEVDIIENPNHDLDEGCDEINCNICTNNKDSILVEDDIFITLNEAKNYVADSLFEMVQDAVLGRSDIDDLINFEINNLDNQI